MVGAGTATQTLEQSAHSVVQYAYNTIALATVPGLVLTRQGSKRWFYITADYPFGRELQQFGSATVEAAGGTVVGSMTNPHGADDFHPFLEAARQSDAQVLGLANVHAELLKAMDGMNQMGAVGIMKVVGLLTFIDDIHEMGLEQAQGLFLANSWSSGRVIRKRANGLKDSSRGQGECRLRCRLLIMPPRSNSFSR